MFSTSRKGREKKKERKTQAIFFLSRQQRVTFFDVSTASLVLQHLLPDALIESPMSNRKRNKCFIELELSLVMVGGGGGEAQREGRVSRLLCGCLLVSVHPGRVILNPQYKHFLS